MGHPWWDSHWHVGSPVGPRPTRCKGCTWGAALTNGCGPSLFTATQSVQEVRSRSPGKSTEMVALLQPSTKHRTPLMKTLLRLQFAGSKPRPPTVSVVMPAALRGRPPGAHVLIARVSSHTVRLPLAYPLPATLRDTCKHPRPQGLTSALWSVQSVTASVRSACLRQCAHSAPASCASAACGVAANNTTVGAVCASH